MNSLALMEYLAAILRIIGWSFCKSRPKSYGLKLTELSHLRALVPINPTTTVARRHLK